MLDGIFRFIYKLYGKNTNLIVRILFFPIVLVFFILNIVISVVSLGFITGILSVNTGLYYIFGILGPGYQPSISFDKNVQSKEEAERLLNRREKAREAQFVQYQLNRSGKYYK